MCEFFIVAKRSWENNLVAFGLHQKSLAMQKTCLILPEDAGIPNSSLENDNDKRGKR